MFLGSLGDTVMEESTSQPAEEPIDHTLVSLPKDWQWIKSGEEGLFAVKMVFIGKRFHNLKSIRLMNKEVHYFAKTKPLTPPHLADKYQSIKELDDIFKYFDDAPLCEGCPEEELMLLQIDSTKDADGIRKTHCWRSKSCELITLPGEKKCQSCLCLKKLLTKRKSRVSPMDKLKKTQTELKNIRMKNQRALTKIMVIAIHLNDLSCLI